MNILAVVDMTNDFIDGPLGTPEAVAIVERAKEKIENFNGKVIYLQDTHSENYLETKEGINLPVEHGIEGTFGWEIKKELYLKGSHIITKNTFGSVGLVVGLKLDRSFDMATDSIEMIGCYGRTNEERGKFTYCVNARGEKDIEAGDLGSD